MNEAPTGQACNAREAARFTATHWSVVLATGQGDSEHRAAALEILCRTYWEPLYAYLRFLGHPAHDAEDLTQAFLLHLLAGDALAAVNPQKGRFRSFLLKSLRNFVADERDRALAARRGGGQQVVSLDAELAERHCREAIAAAGSAEALFDRRWAMGVINRAFTRAALSTRGAPKSKFLSVCVGTLWVQGCTSAVPDRHQGTPRRGK